MLIVHPFSIEEHVATAVAAQSQVSEGINERSSAFRQRSTGRMT
jgi:hypothetical protein